MNILAIETSCDDTCLSVLDVENGKLPRFKILSNIVSSQVKIHRKYGGVYPFLAKREHQKNLPIVFKKGLKEARLLPEKTDLIGVTIGPGLEPCLWVGVNFAKELAKRLKVPIVPVNHIEAHIFANFLDFNSKFKIQPQPRPFRERAGLGCSTLIQELWQNSKFLFPAICLIVSGGHTQLILMKDFGKYKILGETRDDAAGECFDKVARILGLGYPGGPAIAQTAIKYTGQTRTILPRPMIYQKNYDFSFSGLKTAVLYNYKKQLRKVRKSKRYIQEMAAETQQAVIDVLIAKTLRAVKEYQAKSIILGGGVAANQELRKQLGQKIKKEFPNAFFLVPEPKLCTDNAAMVGVAAYFQWLRGETKSWQKIKANANLKIGQKV